MARLRPPDRVMQGRRKQIPLLAALAVVLMWINRGNPVGVAFAVGWFGWFSWRYWTNPNPERLTARWLAAREAGRETTSAPVSSVTESPPVVRGEENRRNYLATRALTTVDGWMATREEWRKPTFPSGDRLGVAAFGSKPWHKAAIGFFIALAILIAVCVLLAVT